MSEHPFDSKKSDHFFSTVNRWFAIECNNLAWDFLENENRTPAESDRMLHSAHAACLHWLQAGTVVNRQRALVLLGTTHGEVNDGNAALRYANSAFKMLEANKSELADWDVAFTYDSLARANAAHGTLDVAADFQKQAREAANVIEDPEDKKIFEDWFKKGLWKEGSLKTE